MEIAANKHGAENIIVASYTRAAAVELNRRDLPIPRGNIGTLHALCYRQLSQYEIAEIKAKEFNEAYPEAEISCNGEAKMDEMSGDFAFATDGDRCLNAYNLQRAKCLPLELMNATTIEWVKKWERWKTKNNYIDFTDMIALTAIMREPAAGEPKVGIYDEVQDFNKLELNLIRSWAKYQDHIILSGDDDQTIYTFCGASPEAFLFPDLPADKVRVLKQSWRLPRKIHEYSQRWIKQINTRAIKEFLPRDEEGSVEYMKSTYRQPYKVIEKAMQFAENNETVMILASCGYILNTVKDQLREAGLPFHNPYRVTRGDWNPLGNFHGKSLKRISTRERLLAFLSEVAGVKDDNKYWTVRNLHLWLELIRSRGILKKNAKDKVLNVIEDHHGNVTNYQEFYAEIFEEFALHKALERDIPWFMEVLLANKRKAIEYPMTVYSKRGSKALEEKPKIIIGTIHSVKGAEADHVIMFPDLSLAGWMEYETNKDATIRTFYVGMTRAKKSLILCAQDSDVSVKL